MGAGCSSQNSLPTSDEKQKGLDEHKEKMINEKQNECDPSCTLKKKNEKEDAPVAGNKNGIQKSS